MAHAYTPGLKVARRTTIRKRRVLPVQGRVLVEQGQSVSAGSVVAEADLPGPVHPANVVNRLGIRPEEIRRYMLKKEGDVVERNEPIAETHPWIKWFKVSCLSPMAGSIESVSDVTGQVMVREPPQKIALSAYVSGTVVEVIPEEGAVVDQFKKLTAVFECSAADFFAYFNAQGGEPVESNDYLDFWQGRIASRPELNFPYSSAYAMQEFLKQIPANSLLHHGNGVAVHMAQYFPTDGSIITYCHTATTTIGGSLSTFIGQAQASDKLCFAFIGDLSFFYDMNAIWNRHVGKNVRILLYNNEGGQTFHWNCAKEIDTLPLHTSAEHFTTAKGWVESRGFRYLSARTKDEFDAVLPEFMAEKSDAPVLFEVFTKKDSDGRVLHDYYDKYRQKLIDLRDE